MPFFETQAFDFEHNGNLNSEQSESVKKNARKRSMRTLAAGLRCTA